MNRVSYCFQKNSTWYYRKKIPILLNAKSPDFKISLKSLLGKDRYYTSVLNNSIFQIISLLNNQIELYFLRKESVTLLELSEFAKNLILRYENKALNLDNDYVNLTLEQKEVEEARFDGLSFVNEDGVKFKGHTKIALEKELSELKEAYEKDLKQLYIKKANDILKRQNIISKNEIEEIKEEEFALFSENLVKKEIEVINQDLNNYNKLNKSSSINTIKLDDLKNIPELKAFFVQKENENWELFIDTYISNYKRRNIKKNTLRLVEVTLTIFKMLINGDEKFGVPKRFLAKMNLDDIQQIKVLMLELPNLRAKELIDWRKKGIIYTIHKAKNLGLKKLLVTGINSMISIFIRFLKDLKMYQPEIFGNLNIDLFEKLRIEIRELSKEDLEYNKKNKKIGLESSILSHFLKDRYNVEIEAAKGQAARNFTRHTSHSPHTFWSVILGAFTGARPDELAQLNISDIKKSEDGIFYLKIIDDEDKSLKTENAIREIPISEQILELGFLNFVLERKKVKAKKLFDLEKNKDGKYKEFQRSFNLDIKKFVELHYKNEYENAKAPSFYDLRSFFITKFLANDYNNFDKLIILKKAVGHTIAKLKNDITLDVYERGKINYRQVYNLISSTDFGIDEGYNVLKKKMQEKYKEILFDIEL
jgi:integrase